MFILSLVVPVLVGISLLYAFCHKESIPNLRLFLLLPLSVGLGFGLSSVFYFLWLSILQQPQNQYIYFEMIVLFFVLVLAWNRRRRIGRKKTSESSFNKIHTPPPLRLLSVSFYILCVSSLVSFILISLGNLHGRWDAWAIWNLRARFIFKGGENWSDVFTSLLDWSNPDYPLLLPSLIAKCWSYANDETVFVPITIALIFTFSTILLLVSSLAILRGKHQAYLGGITLLASFHFIRYGASQCADIPLSFYILAGIVLFVMYDFHSDHGKNLVILSGAMIGLSLWTKNEGVLYLIAILAGRIIVVIGKKDFKNYIRELLLFMIGLIPILSVWAFFKLKYAPPSGLFLSENIDQIPSKLTDMSRYFHVTKLYLTKLIRFENGLLILLCVFILLVGLEKFGKNKFTIFAALTSLLIMYGGYYTVFILTPHNVNWHINTALNRLLLQLWPSAVFLAFFSAKLNLPPKKGDKDNGFNKLEQTHIFYR